MVMSATRCPKPGHLVAALWIEVCCSTLTFPTHLDPMVQLVKIDMAREHEKSSRNQVLPSPGRTGEPGTGNDARTFGPDVITALRLLGEVINEGSKLRPPDRKESLTMHGGGLDLIGCAHDSV